MGCVMDISDFLPQIIVWIVTGVLGIAVGSYREQIKTQKVSDKALQSGVRSLLRNALMETHRRCVVEQGWCTVADKEVTERNYVAYHDLGGNGTGTVLYNEIMSLPIKDDLGE